MHMPKTSVHEHNLVDTRQNDIWLARKVRRVKPVSISHFMKERSDHALRLRITTADSRHAKAALQWRKVVGHRKSINSANR